nr:hypothetical protein [Tanacetum cinerariifolium]
FRKLLDGLQNIHEELAEFINSPGWNRPAVYDDDNDDVDYTIAITPALSTEEPDNSLSMRDEHLDTIPTTESNEVIKSSVKDLVPIPCEFKGIPDTMDLPDPGELISSLNSGIRENLSSTTCVNLPVEDDHSPLLAYVVWI